MLADDKAAELKCAAKDYKCLCTMQNFLFGLRDCTDAVCGGDKDDVKAAVQFGIDFCKSESL